jgi:arabinogalactan endo-1,4-beta-galactosidase
VVIAETAYPFTLLWNDDTNNVVGETSQLVPGYPATPEGQLDFMIKIKEISTSFAEGFGFCYWGADFIAFKGPTATDGSDWENQAFYDFNNKALPVFNVFNNK